MRRRSISLACIAAAALCIGGGEAGTVQRDKEALAALQSFVGQWKGVGQPRRGSTRDAWIEQADWAWKFAGERAAIVFQSPMGKIYHSGEVRPAGKAGEFRFVGTLPDGKTQEELSGSLADDGSLLFTAEKPQQGRPARITMRLVAGGDRLVISMQQPSVGGATLTSLAEIGYTRQGSNFGKGITGPECVVTGGYGSMTVEHKGQKYYVCCTGCRDLFNEDPEAVLAEYRQRKAAEKQQ